MSIQIAGFSLEFLFTGNGSVQPALVNFEPKTQGERIRFLRENRRKTEIEIAEETGFSVHDIYCFENNKKEVPQNFMVVFAHEMKVNLTWLQTGKGPTDFGGKMGEEQPLTPFFHHELKQEVERLKSYVDYHFTLEGFTRTFTKGEARRYDFEIPVFPFSPKLVGGNGPFQ